jgi:hypothetical protein
MHPNPTVEKFIDRNYTQLFNADHYVFIHQNGYHSSATTHPRLCLVGIAPSHPIVSQGKAIEKVNFNVSNHDYSKIQVLQFCHFPTNQAVGKKKKGAPKVKNNTNLVQLNCADGSKYVIKCQVNGTLIETNPNIVGQPDLVSKWVCQLCFLSHQ